MTAIILTYYIQRRKYLPQIIEALKKNKVPCSILIFNQGEIPLGPIEGVTVINSGKNFGCSVRHSMALCIDDDYFFFQDDDLVISPDTIQDLLNHVTDDNIVGVDGCVLTDGYYTTAIPVREETREVDIVTGRVHLCRKRAIIRAFDLRDRMGLKIWRDDDILLSLANSGNIEVNTRVRNLDEEGIGLQHEPQHYPERNYTCKTIYEAIKNK